MGSGSLELELELAESIDSHSSSKAGGYVLLCASVCGGLTAKKSREDGIAVSTDCRNSMERKTNKEQT